MAQHTREPLMGTVSSATLSGPDLVARFSSELGWLANGTNANAAILEDAYKWLDAYQEANESAEVSDWDKLEEEGHELVDALQDALAELAPAGAYFGTLEGDGADFGFWLMEDEN
jgi:hypothetical protein